MAYKIAELGFNKIASVRNSIDSSNLPGQHNYTVRNGDRFTFVINDRTNLIESKF